MLRRGDQGPLVTIAQRKLRNKGWDIVPDGDFGLKTEATVRCFQELYDLTKDGVVGKYTDDMMSTGPVFNPIYNPIDWYHQVPYLSQRDNVHEPNGTCNVTSLAMVMGWFKPELLAGPGQFEDELFEKLQTPKARKFFEANFPWAIKQGFNPRNIHGMLQWLCAKYDLIDKFSDSTHLVDLKKHCETFGPAIISGKFTAGGHIVVVVGQTYCGDLIVNDPFGNWEHGYRGQTSGHEVIYNLEDVKQIWSGNYRAHLIKPRT